MDNTENILQVNNLVTIFKTSQGDVTAVRGISFTVKKGKVLGIVGESGSGKSVTALSVMRLLPKENGRIDSGQVIFDGQDLVTIDEKDMRKIRGNNMAMIFQEPMTALNPVFTIGWQIGEALEIHQGLKGKAQREAIIKMLKLVKIPRAEKVIDEYPNQLSGGMRQRVMIAIALSCNPLLLIADEPTTALDVTIQAQVLELMKELKDDLDTAIMLITHDLGVVAEMADDVIVMYAGKIVESCSVFELYENPKHPYTKGLIQSRPDNFIKGKVLYSIPGMVPSPMNMPKGCAFAPRCSECMAICLEKMPDQEEVASGHFTRCWLYKEGAQ